MLAFRLYCIASSMSDVYIIIDSRYLLFFMIYCGIMYDLLYFFYDDSKND